MASSLSPAAPAYFPQRVAPWIPPPPPPPPVPVLVTYVCTRAPPEFVPSPPHGPAPPPVPCWGIPQPQVPCLPAPGVQGPYGAMAMTPTSGPPAPRAWTRPRSPLRLAATTKHRASCAAPAATAASCGVKAAGDAKEAAANQPSPRSVLAAAPTSPPISPTTSLPASFPYQFSAPAPPAASGLATAVAPAPAEGSVAVPPPQRRRPKLRRSRRARPACRVQVRRAVKRRLLFHPTSERTSLMIRNIPNDFTRMRLINILDEHCFIENESIGPGGVRSEYDFLYLPIDFRTLANKGYAFVNVTSPEAARRLFVHLHEHRWSFRGTAKTCVVDYANLQGRDKLVEHFSGSHFDCHTEEFLPVWFEPPRDGARPAQGVMHVVGKLGRPGAATDGK